MSSSSLLRLATSAVLALSCVASLGCGGGENEIELITVKALTGDQSTDYDYYLCWTRVAGTNRFECAELSTDFGDDFEANTRETFEIEPEETIDLEDGDVFQELAFERQGGSSLLIDDDGWHLAGFEIRVEYGDGSEQTVCAEDGLSVVVNSGNRYDPAVCP